MDNAIRRINTIQWISHSEINCAIQWIVIYPADSAIHRLNNWGQVNYLEKMTTVPGSVVESRPQRWKANALTTSMSCLIPAPYFKATIPLSLSLQANCLVAWLLVSNFERRFELNSGKRSWISTEKNSDWKSMKTAAILEQGGCFINIFIMATKIKPKDCGD